VTDDIAKAAKGGPGAVRSFVDNHPDPDELKAALHGTHDNVKADDTTKVSKPAMRQIRDFKPTQKEIDMMKSAAFPLGSAKALAKAISSNTTDAPGSITVSGDDVIDGHHRWSGVWAISGPDGVISAEDLELPGDTTQKLAAAQLAIAAHKDPNQDMPTASGKIANNILGKSSSEIEKMMAANVGRQVDRRAPGPMLNDEMVSNSSKDKTIAKWAGFKPGADPKEVIVKIIKKISANLATVPSNTKAPAREDMPQLDDKSIGGKAGKAAIYDKLQNAEINIKSPLSPQKESAERDGNLLTERWCQLAKC
jgi:hypothetical protein